MRPPSRPASRIVLGHRLRFLGQLALGLATALVIVASVFYALESRELRRILHDNAVTQHRAEAVQLLKTFHDPHPGGEPWFELKEVLTVIAVRPGVVDASVIDGQGRIIVSANPVREGLPHRSRQVRQAFAEGRPAAFVEVRGTAAGEQGQGDLNEYVEPLVLDGKPHAFVVQETRQVLDAQLATLRRSEDQALAFAGLLTLPVLYLLVGRRLTARYVDAHERSVRDALTGLLNAGSFAEALEQESRTAARYGHPVSLALFDVDHFKQVNDYQRHARGDEVLRVIGRGLATGRASDSAYRIGGDEFAVLLPHTTLPDARARCERLLDAVVPTAGVSVSYGIATSADGDARRLRDQADAALYDAKRRRDQGRDSRRTPQPQHRAAETPRPQPGPPTARPHRGTWWTRRGL